jgi:hypothetical protein
MPTLGERIRESWHTLTGVAVPRGTSGASRESASLQVVELRERLLELELALDNIGWKRELAYADLEFSRQGLNGLIKISRLYALKNPLVKRGVELSALYVFGRGFDVKSDDDAANDIIDDFFDLNARELGHVGAAEKERTKSTDGNLFFICFPQPTGQVVVRTVDAIEMMDVVTDPGDVAVPWYYKREWVARIFDPNSPLPVTSKQMTAWYPALNFDPVDKPDTIQGFKIMWDSPVYHVKVGGQPKWLFGCPRTYAAIDYARAYKEFLDNWLSRLKAISKIGYDVETKGGQQAITNIVNAWQTSVSGGDTPERDFVDRNPSPGVGSMYAHGPAQKVSIPSTANSQPNPEEGRRVGMMVACADGNPETFYGDVSKGGHATAKTMDRPTELLYLNRQEEWRETIQTLVAYALQHAAGSPGGKLREAWTAKGRAPAHLRVKTVKRRMDDHGKWVEVWESGPTSKNGDVTVSVKFPSLLEHDIEPMLTAIATASTLGGNQLAGVIDPKTLALLLLSEIPGVEDPQGIVDAMWDPNDYDPSDYALLPDAGPQKPAQPPPAAFPPAKQVIPPKVAEALIEATKRLTEAAQRMSA